jgi:tetratricopeptide (TPR) repeat protein
MIDVDAEDSFASVAGALLNAGVRSVVAMAYSLYVTGAQTFLPGFYQKLFSSGSVAEAVRKGRQDMFAHPGRICARGKHALEDWLVPVLYQQDPVDFSFADDPLMADTEADGSSPALPSEITGEDEENPYGFIGRDDYILELERAMRGRPAGILIHGIGGVGKTTLARGFVQWLQATQGLGKGCFWFTFNDIHSAEFVINRLGEAIFGSNFSLTPFDQRIQPLIQKLRNDPYMVIWDNFEVVRGIPGTDVSAYLSNEDQSLLVDLLRKLRGGATKIIITSRSEEEWLGNTRRKVSLNGLDGEERWLFLEEILSDMGQRINREDPDLIELMDLLGGHPLCMRVIVPALEIQSAADLILSVRNSMLAFEQEGDPDNVRFYATLAHAREGLPDTLKPLLIPLGLHERYVDIVYMQNMAEQVSETWSLETVQDFARSLVHMGLLFDHGNDLFGLHPALTGYLRTVVLPHADPDVRYAWTRAFVDVMGRLSNSLIPKQLHEQRGPFHLFGGSLHRALKEAEHLEMGTHFVVLLQALALFALNTRSFDQASSHYRRYADFHNQIGDLEGQAVAYHHLGRIAQEQRNFNTAEEWYRKALAISEKLGDEHKAAIVHYQLGMIAQEQRDFKTAEACYKKSLEIGETQGNEYGAAMNYHQLATIALSQRDFKIAETWFQKSLEIKEMLGDEHGAATTYHQLGSIAEEKQDFKTAEQWYRKALAIDEKQGNEHGAAITYHQLGIIARAQGDSAAAEALFRKSLEIDEKYGNKHGAAKAYHQLGIISMEQRDFSAAQAWFEKSLENKEMQGNEYGAAITIGQLGLLAEGQGDFGLAGERFIKSLRMLIKFEAPHEVNQTIGFLQSVYDKANTETQKTLKESWLEAGLPDLLDR